MIARYSRAEMAHLWEPVRRFEWMLKVEQAVAKAQAEVGLIPAQAAQEIQDKPKVNIDRINELEATTKHDVIAFVSQVAETVGDSGRFIHFGLTSSDVLDTALSLQINNAFGPLLQSVARVQAALVKLIREHGGTVCVGRTHGIHAEPTTFGYKMLGFLAESVRAARDLNDARAQMRFGKISGAVGTYSALDPQLEKRVCELLDLSQEPIATQVIPRDRHARVLLAVATWGSFLERLAVELRHLQRTEVSEVIENFTPGQKGSSAMPHKKNPISAENLTGIARLLRSYVIPALENVALWHERDISHSSVERVVFPDAFIVADYASSRMADLLGGLYVDKDRMAKNLAATGGMVFSSHILLLLVEKGWSREEAYKIVQAHSHSLKAGEQLRDKLLADSQVAAKVTANELEQIFSGAKHLRHVTDLIGRHLKDWGF
jgi:adenylosuccinate lyase